MNINYLLFFILGLSCCLAVIILLSFIIALAESYDTSYVRVTSHFVSGKTFKARMKREQWEKTREFVMDNNFKGINHDTGFLIQWDKVERITVK